jgi:hypothetical protein
MTQEERKEFQPELNINLSNVALSFWTDHSIDQWYSQQRSKFADRDQWIKNNQSIYETHKTHIQSLVTSGDIPDDTIEAVWQYASSRFSPEEQARTIEVRNNLASHADDIKKNAAARLSEWLPGWIAPETHVDFKIHESADFAIDDHEIVVDLQRLSRADNPITVATRGVSHELSHVWMAEGKDATFSDDNQKYLKRKIVDEGLAVLIAGDQLEEHHRLRGRDYRQLREEAHRRVADILKAGGDLRNEDIQNLFHDMGPGYITGYDMLDAIKRELGDDGLRQVIVESRLNPDYVFQVYQDIAKK